MQWCASNHFSNPKIYRSRLAHPLTLIGRGRSALPISSAVLMPALKSPQLTLGFVTTTFTKPVNSIAGSRYFEPQCPDHSQYTGFRKNRDPGVGRGNKHHSPEYRCLHRLHSSRAALICSSIRKTKIQVQDAPIWDTTQVHRSCSFWLERKAKMVGH